MMLRSLLFVPGNRQNMLDKALTFRPDAYIPDMEDSIPYAEKADARLLIADNLSRYHTSGIPVIPRVNALETGFAEADLKAVVGPYIAGISIGKIYTPDDIHQVCTIISDLEGKTGVTEGTIKLIPWIETAQSIVHCYAICSASPRIVGVAFGAEDFTHDMGIERSEDQAEVMFARNVMATAAHAADIQALDVPCFSFKDQTVLTKEVLAMKQIGFSGKFAIHPAQVEPIEAAFRPSESALAYAKKVVEVFEAAERTGRGSTSLDGKVIDVPVVKRAYAVLRQAGFSTPDQYR